MPAPPDTKEFLDIAWRDLGYDVGWEASDSGIIRCRKVLNRRGDIFNAVEGVNLGAIQCVRRRKSAADLLRENRRLRHIEVQPPKRFGPEHLYLTAEQLPEGGVVGTFCAIDPRLDDVLEGQLSLLSHISQARGREEQYRYEAEIMLRGLRALLSDATAAEKLCTLAGLMRDAINGIGHLLLNIGPDGSPRGAVMDALAPSLRETLHDAVRCQISPVTVHRGETPSAQALRTLLREGDGDVALIVLPVVSEGVMLACAARRGMSFRPENVEFASRFSLILKQALLLKDEQDKLVQSAKLSALGQMSASLAHELRQPLNTISVAAQNMELMMEREAGPEMFLPKIKRILGQVERASQIMDRVRRFSRKSANDLAPVNLAQLAGCVGVMLEDTLRSEGVALSLRVPEDLSVCCDGVQIEQVLVNLVRNAMDALGGIGSPARVAGGKIAILGGRTPDGIMLRVEDNGPGFPASAIARPLETFFTTKDAHAGTGLGLTVCNMIARGHAGRLKIGNHEDGAFAELHLPERMV